MALLRIVDYGLVVLFFIGVGVLLLLALRPGKRKE